MISSIYSIHSVEYTVTGMIKTLYQFLGSLT